MQVETDQKALNKKDARYEVGLDDSPQEVLLLAWKETSSAPSPFVHRFQTSQNKYLFDINTGRIVLVNPAVWDIIFDFGILSREAIVRKHASHYTRAKILRAHKEITWAQSRHKLFLPNHLPGILVPSEQRVREAMSCKCAWIVLHVTENCNLKCVYCVDEDQSTLRHRRSTRTMSWRTARVALDDYLSHNAHWRGSLEFGGVGFYGGEPLLNMKLIQQSVSYLRQRASWVPSLHVTTNATLLSESVGQYLASEGFCICVSLDGPSRIHDRQRVFKDGAGTWRTVVNNLRAFLHVHPEYWTNGKLELNVVLSPGVDMTELEEYFVNDGLASSIPFKLSPMIETSGGCPETLPSAGENKVDFEGVYEKFLGNAIAGRLNENPENKAWRVQRACCERRFQLFHGRTIATPGTVLSGAVGPQGVCLPGIVQTYVTVDGNYYACEKWPCSALSCVGNIHDGRDPVKMHRLITDFYGLNRSECASCWCVHNCRIGCYLSSIGPGCFSGEVKRKRCDSFRKVMHQTIVDYVSILEQNPRAFDYLRRTPAPTVGT